MEMNSDALLKSARFAGLLYLIWILTGIYAMFYIPAQINTHGDAATTGRNILANEFLFRSGIVNDLLSSTLWIFMALIFYRIFKPVDTFQAKLLVALVVVQIPVAFFMGTVNLASLMIFKGELLKTFELAQRQDLAMVLVRMNDYSVLTLEMFWGLWLFPLAILTYKSRFLPRFLGIWLMITGIFYVILCVTSLMLPEHKDTVLKSIIALPAELGEVGFMLWLLIRGARKQPAETVPAA